MKKLKTICIILIIGTLSAGCQKKSAEEEMIEQTAAIHKRAITIDTHVDTPMEILRNNFDIGIRHNFTDGHSRLDIPRMNEGNLDAAFFAVYVGQGPRDEEGNEKAKKKALSIFNAIQDAVFNNPNDVELALNSQSVIEIVNSGKHAILIGMENGYPIGRDISLVKKYYSLGMRYTTLSHMENNDICDSSTDEKGPEYHGLSKFGEQVVKEMNRLGIMIDISHVSDETFYDVINLSNAPVIASHSCTRALCDHPRNMSDDMLKRLAENGGVIQVTFVDEYVKTPENKKLVDSLISDLKNQYNNLKDLTAEETKKYRTERSKIYKSHPHKKASVSDLVDHIDHVVEVAGIDYVGIGSDFDGGGGLVGCKDVSEIGNITYELVKRGYTEKDIDKIWGGNLLRVFKAVENAAE